MLVRHSRHAIPDVDIPKLNDDRDQGRLPAEVRRCRTSSTSSPAIRAHGSGRSEPRCRRSCSSPTTASPFSAVIELTFSGEDVQVLAVSDGEEAIARIAAEQPDIVLADIGMPETERLRSLGVCEGAA